MTLVTIETISFGPCGQQAARISNADSAGVGVLDEPLVAQMTDDLVHETEADLLPVDVRIRQGGARLQASLRPYSPRMRGAEQGAEHAPCRSGAEVRTRARCPAYGSDPLSLHVKQPGYVDQTVARKVVPTPTGLLTKVGEPRRNEWHGEDGNTFVLGGTVPQIRPGGEPAGAHFFLCVDSEPYVATFWEPHVDDCVSVAGRCSPMSLQPNLAQPCHVS